MEVDKKRNVNDIDRLVSERLKTRRLMLSVDQKKISKVLDISLAKIRKYEKIADQKISNDKEDA